MAMIAFKVVIQAVLWAVATLLFSGTVYMAYYGEFAGAFMALVCAFLTALPPGLDPAIWIKDHYGRR